MNTTTDFTNSRLENSGALVSTLDQDGNEYALRGNKILASRQPTRKWASGLADSARPGAWTLRGIPELDSPLAG